jgi:hypothetical protein
LVDKISIGSFYESISTSGSVFMVLFSGQGNQIKRENVAFFLPCNARLRKTALWQIQETWTSRRVKVSQAQIFCVPPIKPTSGIEQARMHVDLLLLSDAGYFATSVSWTTLLRCLLNSVRS